MSRSHLHLPHRPFSQFNFAPEFTITPKLRRAIAMLFAVVFSLTLSILPSYAQVPTERSLLWEISGKGLTKTSYLYGTIHIACDQSLKLSPALLESFNRTTQLYLELDFDDPNLKSSLLAKVRLPKGKTLRSYLNANDYNTVAQFVQQRLGVPIESVHSLKPFFLMSMLYSSMMSCPVDSWEAKLSKLALARKMPLQGLETVQEQVAAIDRIPLGAQLQALVQTARQPAKAEKELQDLMTLYRNQDIAGMANLMSKDPGAKGAETALLSDRNRRWVPRIGAIAKAKPTFFAVGAGHLGGKEGVISLLRKAGYRVRAVK